MSVEQAETVLPLLAEHHARYWNRTRAAAEVGASVQHCRQHCWQLHVVLLPAALLAATRRIAAGSTAGSYT